VLSGDRTLSGLCDWVEAEAHRPVDLAVEGAASFKAGRDPDRAALFRGRPSRLIPLPEENMVARSQGAQAQMAHAASGSLGTLASRTTRPVPSTTQTLVASQRHIKTSILFHGRPSMMLAGCDSTTPFH
jgi:hypothetical protein